MKLVLGAGLAGAKHLAALLTFSWVLSACTTLFLFLVVFFSPLSHVEGLLSSCQFLLFINRNRVQSVHVRFKK